MTEELADTNSKRTRVEPVFTWLRSQGGDDWPGRLTDLAEGLDAVVDPGSLFKLDFEQEVLVQASPARLAWMIRNAERLTPVDGRRWREYRTRVLDNPKRDEALERLDQGKRNIPSALMLEGPSHADCLIECERAFIWVEGKRNDWLAPSTTWDVTRDQLARNLEAAWLLGEKTGKEFCVLICHEHALKHHEQLLVDGYRTGTWTGGWPHLQEGVRRELARRVATLTWSKLLTEWPALQTLPELQDSHVTTPVSRSQSRRRPRPQE